MYDYEEDKGTWSRFKSFVKECVRVFKITKKPTREEYKNISKIAGLGILVIGLLGFLVHLVNVLAFK